MPPVYLTGGAGTQFDNSISFKDMKKYFTGEIEFKSRPLHFLTFLTGEK